jgi:hypothetical protein
MTKTPDMSAWPIIILPFGAQPTDEEWQSLMDAVREAHKRGQPFAVLADGSAMRGMPSPAQRRLGADLGEFIKQHRPQLLVAWGNVLTSSVLRGAITAIMWIAKPAYPQKFFATKDEALAWCRKMLEEHKG